MNVVVNVLVKIKFKYIENEMLPLSKTFGGAIDDPAKNKHLRIFTK